MRAQERDALPTAASASYVRQLPLRVEITLPVTSRALGTGGRISRPRRQDQDATGRIPSRGFHLHQEIGTCVLVLHAAQAPAAGFRSAREQRRGARNEVGREWVSDRFPTPDAARPTLFVGKCRARTFIPSELGTASTAPKARHHTGDVWPRWCRCSPTCNIAANSIEDPGCAVALRLKLV